jgi:hypothetical protein
MSKETLLKRSGSMVHDHHPLISAAEAFFGAYQDGVQQMAMNRR